MSAYMDKTCLSGIVQAVSTTWNRRTLLMTYKDNVTKVASAMMISNEPRLDEADLTIASLRFFNAEGAETTIVASDMNRGGRLFLQYLTMISEEPSFDSVLSCNDMFREQAAEYFAELWEENPIPGKRPLIDAMRKYEYVAITYKWETAA